MTEDELLESKWFRWLRDRLAEKSVIMVNHADDGWRVWIGDRDARSGGATLIATCVDQERAEMVGKSLEILGTALATVEEAP